MASIAGGVLQLISSQATHKKSGPSTWAPYLRGSGALLQLYGAIKSISNTNLGSIGNLLGSTVEESLRALPGIIEPILNYQISKENGEAQINGLELNAIKEKRSMDQTKESEDLDSTIASVGKEKSYIEAMKALSNRMAEQQELIAKIQRRPVKA